MERILLARSKKQDWLIVLLAHRALEGWLEVGVKGRKQRERGYNEDEWEEPSD